MGDYYFFQKKSTYKIVFVFLALFLNVNIYSQCTNGEVNFTWQGAGTGNQMVWAAGQNTGSSTITDCSTDLTVNVSVDDTDNVWYNGTGDNGVGAGGSSTTGFFGSNGLTVWIDENDVLADGVNAAINKEASLVFDFSMPVGVTNFIVDDIDWNDQGTNSKWRDVVEVTAIDVLGANVPLVASLVNNSSTINVTGQVATSDFSSGGSGGIAAPNTLSQVMWSSNGQQVKTLRVTYRTGVNNTSQQVILIPSFSVDMDTDDDGILNNCDASTTTGGTDTDNDDILDTCDLDDDNDGILDTVECGELLEVQNAMSVTSTTTATVGNMSQLIDGEGAGGTGAGPFPFFYWLQSQNPVQFNITMAAPSTINRVKFYSPWGSDEDIKDVQVKLYNGASLLGTEDITLPLNYVNGVVVPLSTTYTNVTFIEFTVLNDHDTSVQNPKRTSIIELVFLHAFCKDTDGDGTPDYLDLDSDNDGCPDALEGGDGFNYSDLVSTTDLSLGDTVPTSGANIGVPTKTSDGDGQTIGTSQDASQQAAECDPCDPTSELFVDTDKDNIGDACDLDDDNDGILDENECGIVNSSFYRADFEGSDWDTYTSTPTFAPNNTACQNGIHASSQNTTPGGGFSLFHNTANCTMNVDDSVWGMPNPVTVLPNTDYTVSYNYLISIVPVNLSLRINGIEIPVTEVVGGWQTFTTTWNSGTATSILVEIITKNASFVGNDFFLDDITITGNNLDCDKDTDGDGTPDRLDTDSDNDGCPDALEGGDTILASNVNTNGTLDGAVDTTTGVPNNVNTTSGQSVGTSADPLTLDAQGQCDSDGDGVIDANDICNGYDDSIDTDNDSVPDGCDLDNDNDGILNRDEHFPCSVTEHNFSLADALHDGALSNGVVVSGTWDEYNVAGGSLPNSASYAGVGAERIAGTSINVTAGADEALTKTIAAGNVHLTGDPTKVVGDVFVAFTELDVTSVGASFTYTNVYDHLGNQLLSLADLEFFGMGYSYSSPVRDSSIYTITNPSPGTFVLTYSTAAPDVAYFRFRSKNGNFLQRFDLSVENGGINDNLSHHFRRSISCLTDTDGDGTPDYLDLDSDNDGCPDALEGGDGFNYSDLVSTTDLSLGDAVAISGANRGIPTKTSDGDGQTRNTSQDASQQAAECDPCDPTSELFVDTDGDTVGNACDLDDDNDGILDENERCDQPLVANPTTGSGSFQDKIYIFNWTSAVFDDGIQDGDSQVFTLPDGLEITITFSETSSLNSSGVRVPGIAGYRPDDVQTWSGAFLGQLYNTPSNEDAFYEMDGTIGSNFPRLTANFQAVKNGQPFPIDLLALDAESTHRVRETQTWLTNGEGWKHLESINTTDGFGFSVSGVGDRILTINDTEQSGGNSIYYSRNATQINWSTSYTGNIVNRRQGFAFGIYLRCDTDGDGIIDDLDTDSDNDGCPDAVEGSGSILSNDSALTDLAGGSAGGSLQNLGTTSDAEGNPIYPSSGSTGYEQSITAAATDDTINACLADLSLTKTVNNAIPKLGEPITYTLTVTNNGLSNATGIQVTDVLPAGLAYGSDNSTSTSTTYTSNVWNIGNLNANASISLQITATVTSAGVIVNTAEITQSNQSDSDSTPNNGN